jgi:hybrid cluster-associated redox disulfide protein
MDSKRISKDDIIADVLEKNRKASKILFKEGLTCVGCSVAMYETLEQGCLMHGLDVNKVLKKLNQPTTKKKKN